MTRTVKVAVIGTGLAGLTAAHLLKQECEGGDVNFEVHLFEKSPAIGMDSSSISLGNPHLKQDWRIDVPMRSFQGGYYKQLIAFYRRLGVQFRQADFSYSFSSLTSPWSPDRAITTTMIYNGASGRSGVSKPSGLGGGVEDKMGISTRLLQKLQIVTLFAWLTCQLILCYIITLSHSLPFWRSPDVANMKFRDWAVKTTPRSVLFRVLGMDTAWRDYVQAVLIPLLSAVCTSPEEDVLDHPMEEILDYVWLTFGTHHYVVVDGVRHVVTRLIEDVDHLHLASPIIALEPDDDDGERITISWESNGEVRKMGGFQHIILATQASRAVPLLTQYLQSLPPQSARRRGMVERQIQCLKAFEYRLSIVINHTDASLLPDSAEDIRDLNLISMVGAERYVKNSTDPLLCVSPSHTMATHILPTPKEYPPNQPIVFQTTNPIVPPQKEKVLSIAALERAIVTQGSRSALKLLCVEDTKSWWQCPYEAKTRLGDLQGADSLDGGPGIWICGSYAHLGIPLLEGCVISARNVVEQGILAKEGTKWRRTPW